MSREFAMIGIDSEIRLVSPQDRDAMIALTRFNTGQRRIEIPYVFLTTSRRTPPIVEVKPVADIIAGRPEARFDPDTRMLRVRVRVENVGRGVAPPNSLTLQDHSRTLRFADVLVPMLGPGNATDVEIELRVAESAYGQVLQLQALADSNKSVFKLNERNNLSERVPFELPEPQPQPQPQPEPDRSPDLIVGWQGHEFDPETRLLTLQITVRNIGAGIAPAHVVDIIGQSDTRHDRLARYRVGPLQAGQSVDLFKGIRLPTSTLGQTLAIVAIVDALTQVQEADERNNQSDLRKVAIPPREVFADLAVSISTASLQKAGRTIDVTVKIENRGAATSPSTLLILRGDPDSEIAKIFVPSLRPDTSWTTEQTVVPTFRVIGGTVELRAEVDSDNRIPETNKTNNQVAHTVILPFPVLIWGAVGGLVILVLSMIFPLGRARTKHPKSGRDLAEDDHPSAPKVSLAYAPRPDPGFQQIDAENGKEIITLELSLRAVVDPGHQTLLKEDA